MDTNANGKFPTKIILWTLLALAVASAGSIISLRLYRSRVATTKIQGAVIRRDSDTHKQLPIADVAVTVSDGVTSADAQSDASGYFRLVFHKRVWPGQRLKLTFRHSDYRPLDLTVYTGLRSTARDLFVATMTPVPAQSVEGPVKSPLPVSNVRIRYTTNSQSVTNVGSAVRTFQVVNQGNVPCESQFPCSPDGKWKATEGSESMDAGQGHEFGDVRASCIAGPCPFTRIDSKGFVHGGRNIKITALNWSDTATFLLEAEVFQTAISSNVRESYPVIFGQSLNFTLPPTQEGASIEAEINGSAMVFPLGPDLFLSWATCTARINAEEEKSTVYHCELKSGYRF